MSKTLIGIVVSDKVDKTIVVSVQERKTHPLYKKQYSISAKFMAHDPENTAKLGDRVSIVETRPISARKRFKLEAVLTKATIQHVEAEPVIEAPAPPEPKKPTKAKPAKKKEEVT